MAPVRVASLAFELPAAPVPDAELARELRISEQQVGSYSRGRIRRFAPDGVGPAELAAAAARTAIARARMAPDDVEFIIFSTTTPDYTFPGSACLLQAALGCRTVGCLDVRAVCSGFIVALDLARRYVTSGTYGSVLIAAAEVPSHQNRFDGIAPELACLTGDAAAAAIVADTDSGVAVLSAVARTDGARHRLLWCEFPASRHMSASAVARGERLTRAAIEEGRIYPLADFAGLRVAAVEELPGVFEAALAESELDGVDAAIVAHVDPDTEQALGAVLGARARRVIVPDTLYSYSASLPVTLARSVESGAVRQGETVALATAGAGASWAVGIVRI